VSVAVAPTIEDGMMTTKNARITMRIISHTNLEDNE
jgi:hypothetical protein